MNVIINIFFIFIFTFWILFFRIPDIDNRNYLFHKLVIFALLFVYQFSLLVLSKIKNKCKIDLLDVCGYSFETAIVAIIGYSIYTDLQYYDLDFMCFSDQDLNYIYVTIIITLLLTFVNTVKLLLGFKPYECIKYE